MSKLPETYRVLDRALYISTVDRKTALEATAKVAEEYGELMREVLILNGTPGTGYRETSHDAIVEELSDLILCAWSLIHKLNVSDRELAVSLVRKMNKWQEKSEQDNAEQDKTE